MKTIIKFNLLFFAIFLFNCSSEKKNNLELYGKVIGTDAKSIMLIKPNQDTRFDSIIEIPIIDGKFQYKTELQNPEVVNLAFAESVRNGAYRPMPLFLENEKIDLTIYPEEEFDKYIVECGNLNAQYNKYRQSFEDKFDVQISFQQYLYFHK